MRVTSHSRVFAVLGDPVTHSLSPRMHNAGFQAAGLDAIYVALQPAPEAVTAQMLTLTRSGGGGNVTIPFKQVAAHAPGVVRFASGAARQRERFRRAPMASSPSAIPTWTECSRRWREWTISGDAWWVLGTGGSARAVVGAAAERGARVAIRSRDPARAAGFAKWAASVGVATADADECRVVINATPLGLSPADPHPVDPAALRRGHRGARSRLCAERPDRVGARLPGPRPAGGRWTRSAPRTGRRILEVLVSGSHRLQWNSCGQLSMVAWADAARRVERWVLPAECSVCWQPMPDRQEALVCDVCRSRWRGIDPPICPRCGEPARLGLECRVCVEWPPDFGPVRSAVRLDAGVRQLVHRFKYQGWWRLAESFASRMASLIEARFRRRPGAGPARATSPARARVQSGRAARRRAGRPHRPASPAGSAAARSRHADADPAHSRGPPCESCRGLCGAGQRATGPSGR